MPVAAIPVSAITFFDFGSRAITPEGAAVLDNVASQLASAGPVRLRVSGYADRSGRAAVNMRISRQRAEMVASYLASRGVATDTLLVEAFGERRPRVETADGVQEIQNRRVEITVADEY